MPDFLISLGALAAFTAGGYAFSRLPALLRKGKTQPASELDLEKVQARYSPPNKNGDSFKLGSVVQCGKELGLLQGVHVDKDKYATLVDELCVSLSVPKKLLEQAHTDICHKLAATLAASPVAGISASVVTGGNQLTTQFADGLAWVELPQKQSTPAAPVFAVGDKVWTGKYERGQTIYWTDGDQPRPAYVLGWTEQGVWVRNKDSSTSYIAHERVVMAFRVGDRVRNRESGDLGTVGATFTGYGNSYVEVAWDGKSSWVVGPEYLALVVDAPTLPPPTPRAVNMVLEQPRALTLV